MSSCSAASRREAPPSTRAITRMRMSAEYAFGIVRLPDASMPPDSPIYRSLGNLRFYSARTCSSREFEGEDRFDSGCIHHLFSTRRDVRRSVSGIPSHEQNEALLAPSLGQKRLHLRGHPHDALQRAARVRHVERRGLQALPHAGPALPHPLCTPFPARPPHAPQPHSHLAIPP